MECRGAAELHVGRRTSELECGSVCGARSGVVRGNVEEGCGGLFAGEREAFAEGGFARDGRGGFDTLLDLRGCGEAGGCGRAGGVGPGCEGRWGVGSGFESEELGLLKLGVRDGA